ncbi:MAG: hypothetical protein CVU55_02280 [Deltaproteobacteria bacterium HGW-Deltaproteobacteria-13]|nr:MAG: hypothetical protein CVU55_02280 [Deltaproteobacteria bacterium HGW-Deltaproteobacteria-13]
MIHKKNILFFSFLLLLGITACAGHFGGTVISQPDEYSHVYEAKEIVILRAIAGVFKEKDIGTNVRIDLKNLRVDSDFRESGDWRTKSIARVKRLNWKECEVGLSVITEKKTNTGWKMQRLLQKEQYDTFFSVIDLKIYEEMSKIE